MKVILFVVLSTYAMLMQDLADPDLFAEIMVAVDIAINEVLWALVDVNNPNSVIMNFWNYLPIVGSNPLPAEDFLLILATFGSIIAYFKWFR